MKLFSAIILAASLAASAVVAQQNCAPAEAIKKNIRDGRGMQPYAQGLSSNNTLVEMYGNEKTGKWVALITGQDGTACIVASGEMFLVPKYEAPGTDS